jgi:transcriptional regulator with XRE-family HTH domain
MITTTIKKLIASDPAYTKTALARHLAVSRSTLDAYLSGKWDIPSSKIEAIAAYFKVSIGSLFGEKDNKASPGQSIRALLSEQLIQLKKLNKTLDSIAKSLQTKK